MIAMQRRAVKGYNRNAGLTLIWLTRWHHASVHSLLYWGISDPSAQMGNLQGSLWTLLLLFSYLLSCSVWIAPAGWLMPLTLAASRLWGDSFESARQWTPFSAALNSLQTTVLAFTHIQSIRAYAGHKRCRESAHHQDHDAIQEFQLCHKNDTFVLSCCASRFAKNLLEANRIQQWAGSSVTFLLRYFGLFWLL